MCIGHAGSSWMHHPRAAGEVWRSQVRRGSLVQGRSTDLWKRWPELPGQLFSGARTIHHCHSGSPGHPHGTDRGIPCERRPSWRGYVLHHPLTSLWHQMPVRLTIVRMNWSSIRKAKSCEYSLLCPHSKVWHRLNWVPLVETSYQTTCVSEHGMWRSLMRVGFFKFSACRKVLGVVYLVLSTIIMFFVSPSSLASKYWYLYRWSDPHSGTASFNFASTHRIQLDF